MIGIFTATEQACAQVAATASLSTTFASGSITVFKGVDNVDKSAPAVICWADTMSEDFPFSGIWHVKTNIVNKVMAAESDRTEVDTYLHNIQSAFLTPGIEATLTSKVSNYYVYQVVFDTNDFTLDGDTWIHTMGLDIVCTIT